MKSNPIKKPAKRGGKRPGSGRKKGTPNRLTRNVKQYAAQFGEEAIDTLVAMMRNPETPPNSIVSAAKELLERGFGRPSQTVEVSGDVAYVDPTLLKERYEKNMAKTAEYARQAEERRRLLKKGALH
jgi:hypothetical protein